VELIDKLLKSLRRVKKFLREIELGNAKFVVKDRPKCIIRFEGKGPKRSKVQSRNP